MNEREKEREREGERERERERMSEWDRPILQERYRITMMINIRRCVTVRDRDIFLWENRTNMCFPITIYLYILSEKPAFVFWQVFIRKLMWMSRFIYWHLVDICKDSLPSQMRKIIKKLWCKPYSYFII